MSPNFLFLAFPLKPSVYPLNYAIAKDCANYRQKEWWPPTQEHSIDSRKSLHDQNPQVLTIARLTNHLEKVGGSHGRPKPTADSASCSP